MHPLHSTLGTTNFLFGHVLEIPLFLLASQIVLLSCFWNHRRNKICSRRQICHSSLQHEKGEVRNNKHIGVFSQGKYVLLDILVTSSLNYFHFSSEVFSYVSWTPTLKTLYAPWDTSKLLIRNHQSQTDSCSLHTHTHPLHWKSSESTMFCLVTATQDSNWDQTPLLPISYSPDLQIKRFHLSAL